MRPEAGYDAPEEQRVHGRGIREAEADAVVDVIGGLATKEDIQPLVTREELNRALMIQTGVYAAIVALVVALAMSL